MNGIDQVELLEDDISMLEEQIANNNDEIARLEKSKVKIMSNQEDLGEKQTLTTEPDLTSETWEGNSADKFLEIRESIEQEFKSILDLQIEVLIDNISLKITQLEELNETYEDKIQEKQSEVLFFETS